MNLKDIELTDDNHFVAMEYYALIMNRTFLIIKMADKLIGIQGNGMVSAEGGGDAFTRAITATMAVRDDLTNPYSYLKNKYLAKIEGMNLLDGSIINANKTNFILYRATITKVVYNPKKKWGMGPYPHDGRVTIETTDRRKREFIILGNQSGKKIAKWLLAN